MNKYLMQFYSIILSTHYCATGKSCKFTTVWCEKIDSIYMTSTQKETFIFIDANLNWA